MSLSIIVPTVGRPSLAQAIESILAQPLEPGDEVLVIGGPANRVEPYHAQGVRHLPCAPGYNWGCHERTLGISQAAGTHLAFLDDDDTWLPGARAALQASIAEAPNQPALFQMRYASGRVLWRHPRLTVGNVSTQMILVPNNPARLGRWTVRREGDYDFLASCRWAPSEWRWHPVVIASIGWER